MTIPFEIPLLLRAGYRSGKLVRNGALLREKTTGRIVAHLQETSGLARMAGAGFDPVAMAAEGIQIYQNEQIKAGLALVQNLQLANLALTGVGIGVSVASFAIVSRKLDRIEGRLTEIAAAVERVARKVEGVKGHLIRGELAALRAELRRIDEAWSRSDAGTQWRIAADRLLTLEQTFYDHSLALGDAADETDLREQMVDAFALAGSARVSALLAAGEEEAAIGVAQEFAQSLAGLTSAIGAPQLLREMLTKEQGPTDQATRVAAIEQLRPEAEARATALREREDAAATAPLTIAALTRSGVSGRDWLARARNEFDAPLICLAIDGSADVIHEQTASAPEQY